MLHIRHRIPAISYSSSFQEFFRKFSCPDSAVKVRSCTPALYRASPGYVHTVSQKRQLINKKTPVLTRTRDSCFHLIFPPMSPSTAHEVLGHAAYPRSVSGVPGKAYYIFRPAKLRNALHIPIHIRFHSPDSLCCIQDPTLFFLV